MNVYDTFSEWLYVEGKRPQTITTYQTDVRLFYEAIRGEVPKDAAFSRVEWLRYLHTLQQQYKITTINKKVNSMKVWGDYLVLQHVVTDNPIRLQTDRMKLAAGSEHHVDVLSDEQVAIVLAEVEKPKYRERDRLMVYLLLYTAMRVSELVQLQWQAIDRTTRTLIVTGKGGKQRELVLRQEVMAQLLHYQTHERARSPYVDSPYVLVAERAAAIHRDTVRRFLADLGKAVGFHLHPHLFRRTCATLLLKRGVPIVTVSKILGHHSVDMTSKMYIQTSREDKQAALDLL